MTKPYDPLDNPDWEGFANPTPYEQAKDHAEGLRRGVFKDIERGLHQAFRNEYPLHGSHTTREELDDALRRLKEKGSLPNIFGPGNWERNGAEFLRQIKDEVGEPFSEERRERKLTGILADIDHAQKADLARKREAWDRRKREEEDAY